MGQLNRNLPDFRLLSSAERSKLAEDIWEHFVAAHPESAGGQPAPVQEFARPEPDIDRSAPTRSWSAARAGHLAQTRSNSRDH
ncbi:MAG: hypothetical protein SF172_10020 [Burkholderiales bacterium]|nr:hypothetical protein [Burkholderiales bacterium]